MARRLFWPVVGCLLVNLTFWLFIFTLLEPQP